MTRDDTPDDRPDAADAPATAEEQAQAASLARLIDQFMAGETMPSALAPRDRALLEAAAMVHAGVSGGELAPERQSRLIDSVLAQAAEQSAGVVPARPESSDEKASGADAGGSGREPGGSPGVIDLGARRRRLSQRVLPWALAAAAAAAAVFMAVERRGPVTVASAPAEPGLTMRHRSRAADALVGQIPRDRAGHASQRLDMIFADRLDGYRDLRFRGGHQ